MNEYKITLKNHIKHLWQFLLFIICLSLLILSGIVDPIPGDWFIYFLCIVLVIVSFINIYLHLEYYMTNRGVRLYYDENNGVIKYIKGENETVIKPDNIDKIEVVQSFYLENRGGFLPTDKYHFYRIILRNNDTLVITSLLCLNFSYLHKEKEAKIKVIASILLTR